jgi:hypothetical protein
MVSKGFVITPHNPESILPITEVNPPKKDFINLKGAVKTWPIVDKIGLIVSILLEIVSYIHSNGLFISLIIPDTELEIVEITQDNAPINFSNAQDIPFIT